MPVIRRNLSWVMVSRIRSNKSGRHDRVGHTGLVFEGNEHKALGRAGALAADDDPGNRDFLAVGRRGDFIRLPNIGQLVAHQSHRVWSRRQSLAAIVRLHALDRVHRLQGSNWRGSGLGRGIEAKIEVFFVGRSTLDFPECGPAVAAEIVQRAQPGQSAQFVLRKGETLAEIIERAERRVPSVDA